MCFLVACYPNGGVFQRHRAQARSTPHFQNKLTKNLSTLRNSDTVIMNLKPTLLLTQADASGNSFPQKVQNKESQSCPFGFY